MYLSLIVALTHGGSHSSKIRALAQKAGSQGDQWQPKWMLWWHSKGCFAWSSLPPAVGHKEDLLTRHSHTAFGTQWQTETWQPNWIQPDPIFSRDTRKVLFVIEIILESSRETLQSFHARSLHYLSGFLENVIHTAIHPCQIPDWNDFHYRKL